jgi:hypothetical protein
VGSRVMSFVVIVGRSASVAEKTGEQALLRRGGGDDGADRDKVELLALLVSELGCTPPPWPK